MATIISHGLLEGHALSELRVYHTPELWKRGEFEVLNRGLASAPELAFAAAFICRKCVRKARLIDGGK
jgi:hypothetical protein